VTLAGTIRNFLLATRCYRRSFRRWPGIARRVTGLPQYFRSGGTKQNGSLAIERDPQQRTPTFRRLSCNQETLPSAAHVMLFQFVRPVTRTFTHFASECGAEADRLP